MGAPFGLFERESQKEKENRSFFGVAPKHSGHSLGIFSAGFVRLLRLVSSGICHEPRTIMAALGLSTLPGPDADRYSAFQATVHALDCARKETG